MSGAWSLEDVVRIGFLCTFLIATAFNPEAAVLGQERTEAFPGIVVEELDDNSTLKKAGIQLGDILFEWERPPNPPVNPDRDRGRIESVFDWMWLEIEQAPRGSIFLKARRNGNIETFEVYPGNWTATVRANMTHQILGHYSRGKKLINAGRLEEGIDHWHRAVSTERSQIIDTHLRCWILLMIGDTWNKAQEWEKANTAYKAALEQAKDPLSRIAVLRTMGLAFQKARRQDMAREALVSAQLLRENNWGRSLDFARGSIDLGRLSYYSGDLDQATERFEDALSIGRLLAPNSLGVAESLNALGSVAYRRGDLDQATKYLETSLKIREELAPNSLDVAKTLTNLGNVASDHRNLDTATEYHRRALDIFQNFAPDSLHVANSLNNLGVAAQWRGDRNATEYYERALEIRQRLAPKSMAVAVSLNNLGTILYLRGHLDRAAENFEQALEIRQRLAPESLAVARSLSNLGNLALRRGDLDRASQRYEQALNIFQKSSPHSSSMAKSLTNLGIAAYEKDDLGQAFEYHKRALEILQTLNPASLSTAMSLTNLGNVALSRDKLGEAKRYHELALEIKLKLAPGGRETATSLENLGLIEFSRGNLTNAEDYYNRALTLIRKSSPSTSQEAKILHSIGTLKHRQGRLEDALKLFLEAIEIIEKQVDKLGGSWRSRAEFRAERIDYYYDAISLTLDRQLYEQAFNILERSRAQSFLTQLTERDLTFDDIPEELERQRQLIAWNYDRVQHEISELNLNEQEAELKILTEELQNIFWNHEDINQKIVKSSPKLGALRYPAPLNLNAARQNLDPGTAMLSFSVSKHNTYLFVLTRDDNLRFKTLEVGQDTLREDITTILRLQGEKPDYYSNSFFETGERLYKTLIEPVEALIGKSERLLILPDGPLHMLPFALLPRRISSANGQKNQHVEYLAEWKPLHSALSATVYAELKNQRREYIPQATDVVTLTAFGDPSFPQLQLQPDIKADKHLDIYVRTAARRGFEFNRLPHSRNEVTRITDLYPEDSVRTFLGAKATEQQAKSIGKSTRILHFATHGVLDSQVPFNSYLALTIPEKFKKDQENGLLQVWEIFESVRLDADLVVLSACQSGLGNEVATEGLIGLTRAFQFAGARTVISTLWQVDDQATAELMVRFYKHLRSGLPKDEALRAAQMEFIRGPIKVKSAQGQIIERDFSKPYYWAGFQVVGDWK